MQIDLAGQVMAIRLAATNALLPLFEAVVNSVQAVQERDSDDGRVEITISRHYTLPTDGQDSQGLPDILGFEIIDNGVGFTEKHYTSFDTSFSTLKAHLGGKGVGRLVWLKAFDKAAIESVFSENGEWYERKFQFVRSRRGIEDMMLRKLTTDQEATRTKVSLVDFQPFYREAALKGAEPIGRRLVEHCLVMYMLGNMPTVIIKDSTLESDIDLGELYRSEVEQSCEARRFIVAGHELAITDVLLRASADSENAIHFCANKRKVQSRKLSGVVAHAENLIRANGVELRYAACVTGVLLDQALNNERTGFVLDRANELALGETNVTWEEVEAAAIAKAAEYLAPRLAEAKRQAVERIVEFINHEEPRYRILLEHRRDEVEQLSGSLTDEKLELELHKIHTSWRHEAKAGAARRLESIPQDAESFAEFRSDIRAALGELAEVVKADLAEYVVHRRTVLDFFGKILGVMESGTFSREDVLHSLFFPLRTDSAKIDYEDHNLWLLDERLAFHHYLASDLPFKKQEGAPLQIDSEKRPDLLIFNSRLSFSEEELCPYNAIAIVEFKRPERNDYSDTTNPVQQVYGYIRDLRAGKAKYPDGSSIEAVPNGTRFYCHIVVSITPKLAVLLEDLSFRRGPDGDGYFFFNESLNAMVEVVGYRKVLHDALKRNKAFFHRLGLHTGVNRKIGA